ncbi:DUF1206 domain-containing protein [Rhizobium sp. CC-YZS058]|uniref:DUF1206 domain-containing protein n=1 Tax=Rhizobium sp. CC-YZS058 TaxID=3042153 RepID=UPI002B0540C6|nr:DUF1206 domain-containing protein [Rhizobium sp. CC-YZS058]MEA3534358.1 DUF1206 domain-containing protein [Rhizobium sp. CC-YZS058]
MNPLGMHKTEMLAKLGYSARGIVYLLVGAMALFGSIGGGRNVDSKSALDIILEQPLGWIWLGLVALGLLCFVLWRVVQAVYNPDRQPDSSKGYAIRAGLAVSAVTYLSLALYAAGHAFSLSLGSDGGGSGEESLAAWLMSQPFGRLLAFLAGLAIIGAGIAQIGKGVKKGYSKYISIPLDKRAILEPVCTFGLLARGAVFLITGVFFLYAAWRVDPSQAGSLADAMDWVRALPFGGILYAIAALGLFAFGIYSLIEARYRHIARVDPTAVPKEMASKLGVNTATLGPR